MLILTKNDLTVSVANYDSAMLYLNMGYSIGNLTTRQSKQIIDKTFGKTFSQNINM